MAQSFPLHLLLLLLVAIEQSSSNLFDLEDVVYHFLVQNCNSNERLSTYDITGDSEIRNPEILGKHPPVTIKVGPVKYGKAQVQFLQLSAVYVQIFHNNQCDVDGKAQISEEVQHEDEYMWTVTKGFEFTAKVKFNVNVPLVYQFSSEFSSSVKTTSGSTTVETRTTKQLIKQDVIIPAGATIEAKWYVNEAQVIVPWESDIYLEGSVAALCEASSGALTWRYFNVKDIKHEHLEINGTSVRFRASGLFKANVAQSYHLSTSQKELTHRTATLAKYIFEQESE
uniref:Putative cytotoxin-like protein n=1 Tax=Ixodes ricinus TaxID=34613 RepID=A0A0K8R6Q4_IXORI